MRKIVLAILILFTQSCANNFLEGLSKPKLSKNMGEDYTAPTNQLNKTRELLDGASITFPTSAVASLVTVSKVPQSSV